ncbi:TIGR01777 family oxidoreductase [Gryllotalpicola koreensis]|uniref:TIGR01777 family oxidoreductase n=1 Tax=Gryllotalpicola koreensis TaxID=993086 RepID=A0ABP8A534_9MICO
MRIVIAGASGLIGTELTRQLTARGDEVVRLVRGQTAGPGEASWDPASDRLDPAVLANTDAVVNLAGAPISSLPWTRARKAAILRSRVDATTTIVHALAEAPVGVLVNGSAVGFYGSRPGERLTESASAGDGFLAEVVQSWEAAALAAPPATRVVLARTGVVVGNGGAIAPLRLLAKFGAAGPLGSGRQHWPWISLRDEAAALVHLIDHELSGPVNLSGPSPAAASDLIRAVARSLNRPYWLPAPAPLLTLALGEAARELLLADQLQVPQALLESGFRFRDATVADAVAQLGLR